MSTFLGPEQQSVFNTLSNWPWDLSDSRSEVNSHLAPLADEFVFVSRDDKEFPVLADKPTIVVPRINHSQLPPETLELVMDRIQVNAFQLGVKFRSANAKLAAQKAEALLASAPQPSQNSGRFVARSGTGSPAPVSDAPRRGRPPKAGKGKAAKGKPYGRPPTPAPPPIYLTPSEQTFRQSQHISPKSFVFVRDKYLSYWSSLLAYRKLFASPEEVPPVDPLPLIGTDGSTERKFRLAVGKYLVGEGKIPGYLVEGQRGDPGLVGIKKGKGGRWGKGVGGFGKKKVAAGGGGDESSTGTTTSATGGIDSGASTPMESEASVGGAGGGYFRGYFPSATTESTTTTNSLPSHLTPNSDQLPLSACPPYLTHHQHQSFTPTFDHLTLSSAPGSRASSSTSSSNDSARPHTPPESAAPTPSPSHHEETSSSTSSPYLTLASLAAVMNIPLPSAQV